MHPRPDHGEKSYKGSGKLKGLNAVITGGDNGIGRAVAIAFAREGADVLIAYLNEDQDAKETQRLVEEVGRKTVLVAGDISAPSIAVPSSTDASKNWAAPTSWSTTPRIRRGSSPSRTSATMNGSTPSRSIFTRCSILNYQGGGATHEKRRLHHQYGLDQC